jgi:hypothetical protein
LWRDEKEIKMGWTFFLVLLLLILVLPLVVVYGLTRRQFGQETARKNSLVVFISILVGTGLVVGLRFLPGHRGESLLTIVLLVVTLAACVGLVRYRTQVAEAGDVLVDMGCPPRFRFLAAIGFLSMIVAGGLSVYRGLTAEEPFELEWWRHLVQGLFSLVCGASLILWWSRGTTVHRTGIAGPGFFLPWERIEGYAWDENPPGVLKLRVQRRIPFLGETPIRTDPERRAEIEEVLQQFLPL